MGHEDGTEINDALGLPAPNRPTPWNLATAVEGLERSGLVVTVAQEARSALRFHDVGALVYHLRRIPWQVPGFDTRRDLEALRHVHEHIRVQGPLVCTAHRFLVQAHRG